MTWLDYIVLVVLVLLIVAAAFRRVVWIRMMATISLLAVALFFEMSLDAMARAVVTQRTREGRWTRDYADGAYDMKNWLRTFRPYRLIPVAGLTMLAFRNIRKDQAAPIPNSKL